MRERFPTRIKIEIVLWTVLFGAGMGYTLSSALGRPFGSVLGLGLQTGAVCGMAAGFVAFGLPVFLEPLLETRLKGVLGGAIGGTLVGVVLGPIITILAWLIMRAVIAIQGRPTYPPPSAPVIIIMAVIGLLFGIAAVVVLTKLEKAGKLPRLDRLQLRLPFRK